MRHVRVLDDGTDEPSLARLRRLRPFEMRVAEFKPCLRTRLRQDVKLEDIAHCLQEPALLLDATENNSDAEGGNDGLPAVTISPSALFEGADDTVDGEHALRDEWLPECQKCFVLDNYQPEPPRGERRGRGAEHPAGQAGRHRVDDDDGEEGGEHDGRLSAKDKEARQRQQRRDLELAATVLDGDSDDEGGAANLGDDNQQDDDGAELPFSFMRAEAALDLHDEPGWGSNGGSSNPGFDVASAGDDDPLQPCSLSKSPGAALEDEEATQCACATRRRDAGSRQSGDRDGACAAGWRRPPMAREGTMRR